ncbi:MULTISPECIES: FadR/GntR family transcriptional regulator [Micromonospora]|uniref:FadR family transcriptional regulator n=1 Tax=Micromonospora solifontis TaxID=2487138 RepID=A0ABX9WEG9_9ACTN|nr:MULTISPECIES: FCD domain-containing protein [Micromonospora]NES15778.1 FadR family transcriptional regulator [Micromonospora sp. PPF5-17B]NES38216.1 FadR family transcriptional regulator [Micromonospora solifontis]NES56624.1 FadR family transcriptional regulator [Micromonospora sp. PPF5-6]RNL96404.1 FadR family transcriptional regulator [Micromonospora solifontis]
MTPPVDSVVVPPRGHRVRQTIEQLRARILGGEWPVGAKIPTEPQLVAALGVGRNTVREAVRALVHAGVLECRQGSGTYVVSTDELAPVVARRLTDDRMAEVIEVRRAFEVEAARLAALRRTPEDLAALDGALAVREAAWRSGRVDDFVEADAALHTAVVAAAHNAMLAELYASVGVALRSTVAQAMGDALEPGRYVDHGRLVEAIRAGDPARAAIEAGAFLEAPAGA